MKENEDYIQECIVLFLKIWKSNAGKSHKYKNKILCIESLMYKNKYEELESYLGNISAGLEKELDAITTKHVIVDAILNTKYSEMLDKNIIFVFKINNLGKIRMTD